jgi:hypothetical protein
MVLRIIIISTQAKGGGGKFLCLCRRIKRQIEEYPL